MDNVVNYIKCLACDKEWAEEISDGLCEKCNDSINADLQIAELWKTLHILQSIPPEELRRIKPSVVSILQRIKVIFDEK